MYSPLFRIPPSVPLDKSMDHTNDGQRWRVARNVYTMIILTNILFDFFVG